MTSTRRMSSAPRSVQQVAQVGIGGHRRIRGHEACRGDRESRSTARGGSMSGRKAREQRQVVREVEQMLQGIEVAIFEEIEPSDPRFQSFGPNATRETLDEALRQGDLHPDCPLCQAMLAHGGPSILSRVVPDTDA